MGRGAGPAAEACGSVVGAGYSVSPLIGLSRTFDAKRTCPLSAQPRVVRCYPTADEVQKRVELGDGGGVSPNWGRFIKIDAETSLVRPTIAGTPWLAETLVMSFWKPARNCSSNGDIAPAVFRTSPRRRVCRKVLFTIISRARRLWPQRFSPSTVRAPQTEAS